MTKRFLSAPILSFDKVFKNFCMGLYSWQTPKFDKVFIKKVSFAISDEVLGVSHAVLHKSCETFCHDDEKISSG